MFIVENRARRLPDFLANCYDDSMDNKIFFSVCRLLALGIIVMSSISACKPKTDEETDEEQKPLYEKVLLDHFPVSLDFLFRTADPARHNQILNGIRSGLAIASDVLGVFCDAFYPGSVPNYEVIGGRYMVRCDGDSREGIVRLDNFFANVRPSPLYLKYELVEGSGATIWDDQLHVDYFISLAAARGPFSSNKLTYVRMYERTD